MAFVYAPRAAKFAQVRINGGNALAVKSWKVDVPVSEIDVTSTESGGKAQYLPSFTQSHVTINFFHSGLNNPYDAPYSLQSGNYVTALTLYLNTVAGPFWLFPNAFVLNTPMEAEVRDALKGEMSFRTLDGNWVYPTGNF